MPGFNLRTNQKLKTLQRGSLIVASASILGIICYFTLFINTVDTARSVAANRNAWIEADPINNGEIVCMFAWDKNPVTKSDIGPAAKEACMNAECIPGGKDNTFGLSAGNSGKNIDLKMDAPDELNIAGIDISVDYKCLDATGSFFCRGNYFNFGIKDHFIVIQYKVENEKGKTHTVDETTRYEIQEDNLFRNYRFLFDPVKGRGEIFVDNVAVWVSEGEEGNSLWWKKNDQLIIAKGMNGNASAKVMMDNFIVRNTQQVSLMPFQLLSFTAELQGENVMLNWFTAKEKNTDYFRVERSIDTRNFEEIGKVAASKNSVQLKAYALLDTHPYVGVSYYRLVMNDNKSIKSVWIPVIAFRLLANPKNTSSVAEPVNGVPVKDN